MSRTEPAHNIPARPASAAASVRLVTLSLRSSVAVSRFTVRSETCSSSAISVVVAPDAMSCSSARSASSRSAVAGRVPRIGVSSAPSRSDGSTAQPSRIASSGRSRSSAELLLGRSPSVCTSIAIRFASTTTQTSR